MTKQQLQEFEAEVAAAFNAGLVRAPVHLSGGNEDQLIDIFRRIKPHDYVFSTWRSHFHALLHGVPREQLMAKVLAGESISINVPEHRFYSSAICGGCLPIALGVAWSIKQGELTVAKFAGKPVYWTSEDHVWCFVGDMAACMGAFVEAKSYAENFGLPITFVIEDNAKCVNADTRELWGLQAVGKDGVDEQPVEHGNVIHYGYRLAWPHMGTGIRVEFDDKQEFRGNGGM